MDERDYRHEHRRQRRLEQLGSNKPRCIISGESDPAALHRHHPGGRKYTNEMVVLSLNHHAKAEELRRDHPPEQTGPPTQLEREGRLLLGIADLLSLVKRVPLELIELIRQVALRLIDGGQVREGEQP
jgi:hypothetical protein